jgi:iron complex transport system substrate-binding protein
VRAWILASLAAFAAAVAGCQESGFDERKETARPLKVQHALGESKVPGQAERPATLTVDALDDVLALGVRPVRAAVPKLTLPAYLRGPAADISLMRPVGAADLPALEAAAPDLVIGRETGMAFYDELSAIAPTVMLAAGGAQWKLNLRLTGEALGRTNDAEALLTDYDGRVARVGRSIGGKPRVAVARAGPDRVRLASPESFAATVLADAGLRRARSVEAADLVLLARGSSGGAQVELRGVGRTEEVDAELWFGPGGILAARAALRDLRGTLSR